MKPSVPHIVLLSLCSACTLLAQPSLIPIMPAQPDADTALVISLLGQNLPNRTFSFKTVAEACSGKTVYPLTGDANHQRVAAAIGSAVAATMAEANQAGSPIKQLPQLDEALKFFQEGVQRQLNTISGIKCDVPPTREGQQQAPGYPELRVTDLATKQVFYLTPKFVPQGSAESDQPSFGFRPENETLKVTEDAVHLLVGIEYEGKTNEWTFKGWRLVDLSKTRVRLKAEFQATNGELYQKTGLSTPE